MDANGGSRHVGQGAPFIKSGRGVRSKVGPKIRRTLSQWFCVTSNLNNTTHKHKERAEHPRKRAETGILRNSDKDTIR